MEKVKLGLLLPWALVSHKLQADCSTGNREALRRHPRYKYLHIYKIFTHFGRGSSWEIKVLTGYKGCICVFHYSPST